MLTQQEVKETQKRALEYFKAAGIVITKKETNEIEVTDLGLGRLDEIGVEILVYVNTERCCAKELVLFPYQTCPEHCHPMVNEDLGKEETFRCRWGKVFLYVPGEATKEPHCRAPRGREQYFTVWHEIELNPGDQYTLMPDTLHWFQAGSDGAVVSEFSTRSRDEFDIFTDPEIERIAR